MIDAVTSYDHDTISMLCGNVTYCVK